MKPLKNLLIIFIYFSNNFLLLAQKEANVWVFGKDIGIDFNYNRFTPFEGTGMDQLGASASICDKNTGELLFYTDGRNVWNRNYSKMPNGYGLRGGYGTTQAALIIPHPERENKFFIFTTKSYSDTIMATPYDSKFTGCYYSVIDMNKNKGFGDVVEKNILMLERATEKLTAVPHSNGKDYWLITHEWGSDKFVVYELTSNGVGSPKYYSIGIEYGHIESQGWLVASPNGEMLASAVSSAQDYRFPNPLELYSFNSSTGEIKDRRELGKYPNLICVAFSPNNTKLYFSYFDGYSDFLMQLDLDYLELDNLQNALTEINFIYPTPTGGKYDTLSGGQFQLAVDGRLYTSLTRGVSSVKDKIFYINKPNMPGLSCEPSSRNFIVHSTKVTGIGVPNLLPAYFNNLEPIDNFKTIEDCNYIEELKLFPIPTADYMYLHISDKNCLFPYKYVIYNCLGQVVERKENYKLEDTIVDLKNIATGVYIIKFDFPFGVLIKKILKI